MVYKSNVYNLYLVFEISLLPTCTNLEHIELQQHLNYSSDVIKRKSQKRESRICRLVLWMNLSFLVCWLPYAVIALCYMFGYYVPPTVVVIPLMTAKSSVCWNPFLHVFI